MAKNRFGCSSIINAINLQFELAGHGLYTDIQRAKGGRYLCNHTIKRASKPSFMERWLEQSPKDLT